MTLGKSRLKELEERWKRNRRKRAGAAVSIVAFPADMRDMASLYRPPPAQRRSPSRPKQTKLRGVALVQKLAGLALEWHDQRFAQCARALFELGIVDKRSHRFTKKRGPHAISPIDSAMAYAVAEVRARMDRDPDLSGREACAVVTADLGLEPEAASFEAAHEHLRQASLKTRNPTGKQPRG
jgi:hypothetical protein